MGDIELVKTTIGGSAMGKVVIWGAGGTGKEILSEIRKTDSVVVGFIDINPLKWGGGGDGIAVFSPTQLKDLKYDSIIIGTTTNPHEIKEQLISEGIPKDCIDVSYVEYTYLSRIKWLENFATILGNEPGEVAEAGVFRGDFAKEINRCFKDKTLYLFDTFSGFDERDLQKHDVNENAGHLNATSEQLVLSKMPFPDKCIIRKGYFPDSAKDLPDQFCFVNLDMDLFRPTLEGLRLFSAKMTDNGIMLVHDFFNKAYGEGIRNAVYDFISERSSERYRLLPIGDAISIALVRCN
jgi:hypothetical protein